MLTRPDLLNMGPVKDLYELADRLDMMPANDDASAAAGFDMLRGSLEDQTEHPCGSAACIGGWMELWDGVIGFDLEDRFTRFGILFWEASKLCYPENDNCQEAYRATPQQAARAVRILADTGKTDWDRAMQEVPA